MTAHGLKVGTLAKRTREHRLVATPHIDDLSKQTRKSGLGVLSQGATGLLYKTGLNLKTTLNELIELIENPSPELQRLFIVPGEYNLLTALGHLDPKTLPQNLKVATQLPREFSQLFGVSEQENNLTGLSRRRRYTETCLRKRNFHPEYNSGASWCGKAYNEVDSGPPHMVI